MIPINDLKRSAQLLRAAILPSLESVIESGNFILGVNCLKFEMELASYLGVKGAVAVSSGTDALVLAFRSIGLASGDTILATPNAGGYTAIAAKIIGLNVVYADCDNQGRLSMPSLIDACNNFSNIRAVVATHLYGLASPVGEIRRFCDERKLMLVEDCAQALGGRVEGKALGSFGDVSTFSFYPTKNLGAYGDAGAIASSKSEVLNRAKALRQYGWSDKYHVEFSHGENSRMDEFQAAVLIAKLPQLNFVNQVRREIWARYARALEGSSWEVLGSLEDDFVAHLAVIRGPSRLRDRAREHFHVAGIETAVHYPVLDFNQEPWSDSPRLTCGNAETLSECIFTIPLFPELREIEIESIVRTLSTLRELT